MRRSTTFAWSLFALLGLALAAGVSIAASHLSSERIGLSSEPITAGKRLAAKPAAVRHTSRRRHKRPSAKTTASPSAPPVATVPGQAPVNRPQAVPAPQAPAAPARTPKQPATTPRKPRDDYGEPEQERETGGDD